MGRASIKPNKTVYQKRREELELTREEAADLLEYISSDRIEKIEAGKSNPHPDEILLMSEKYQMPHLCNYFCATQCPIGKEYVPEIHSKELSQIVLETLHSMNVVQSYRDRLIDITVDGRIESDELDDFVQIQKELESLSINIEALQLWTKTMISKGIIDEDEYEEAMNSQE
ncbi:MAG: helix-turn-helix domain-containing protein [Erysipelotrichaceae bacterium]|nr:helix-turn-helix domain-containing protein [Erysipelotrichaceae bacterium]